MKKYILFLLTILVVLGTTLITNMMIVNDNINKTFNTSGYILKNNENSERFHFSGESTYKNSYNDQIVFNDTEGEKIVINKYNFIHYEDGSISSFTKGVLIDLNTIDTEPITYYNISANKILKKLANGKYITKNLDKELQFDNIMWRISESKYLVAGNTITILFADGSEKQITGFLELEYSDNQIVKIFNQEVSYETISSDVYLKVGDNVKINIGTKIVSKNDINEMTLENMVIDSNDNVTIIDMEEYKEEEEEEEENEDKDEDTTTSGGASGGSVSGIQGGNASSVSGGDSVANGGTTIVGDSTGDNTQNEGNTGGSSNENIKDEIAEDLSIYAPKFTIKDFNVTSTRVTCKVEITDEEARLTQDTIINVLDNSTGKIIEGGEIVEPLGKYEINIDISTLNPDKEYTLVMKSSFKVEDTEYSKNFVYKIFRTHILGLTLSKDVFTDESLAFNIDFESDSSIKTIDVILEDPLGNEPPQPRMGIQNESAKQKKIEFTGLTPDKEYIIKIANIELSNAPKQEYKTYEYTYKTLKKIYEFENGEQLTDIEVQKNERDGKFILSIPNLDFENAGIDSLYYEIFTITDGVETVVYSKEVSKKELEIQVDGEKIKRNVDYHARVYATLYDNEKIVEYKIAQTTNSFIMDTKQFPTIRFEEEDITWERIKGYIIIEDDSGTIVESEKIKIKCICNLETAETIETLYSSAAIEGIPVDINNLRKGTTYKLEVYATIDLQDGNNPIQECYIGTAIVNTKNDAELQAKWTQEKDTNEKSPTNQIDLQLLTVKQEDDPHKDLAADTLRKITINLYEGEGIEEKQPIASSNLEDINDKPYESSLRDSVYDNTLRLIDLNNYFLDTRLKLNNNSSYTLQITEIYDYTTNKNLEDDSVGNKILIIGEETFTFESGYAMPENPEESLQLLSATTITKNELANNEADFEKLFRNNENAISAKDIIDDSTINNDTVVGYKLEAHVSVQEFKGGKIKYYIYDSSVPRDYTSKEESQALAILTIEAEIDSELESIPIGLVLLENAENAETNLVRGKTYYFACELETRHGQNYPTGSEDYNWWQDKDNVYLDIEKQQANITMYPSISDSTSCTYKYLLSDIDNSIVGSSFTCNFNGKSVTCDANETNIYNEAKFDFKEYISGSNQLRITTKEQLLANEEAKEVTHIQQNNYKFKNEFNLDDKLDYSIENVNSFENSKVNIKLDVSTAGVTKKILLNDISKIRINFELEGKNETFYIDKSIENVNKQGNIWNIIVPYYEIIYATNDSIKGKELNISLDIYYANGVSGFDVNNSKGIAFQDNFGNWLDNFNKTSSYPIIHTMEEVSFPKYKINGKEFTFEPSIGYGLKPSEFNYNSTTPKEMSVYSLNNDSEDSKIEINNIVPTVSGVTMSPVVEIAMLRFGELKNKDTLKNLYIELYNNKECTELVEVKEWKNSSDWCIDDLQGGQKYYFKIFASDKDIKDLANFTDEDKYYVYDKDYDKQGYIYNFTANELDLNIKTEHILTDYYKKQIKVSFDNPNFITDMSGYIFRIYEGDKVTGNGDVINNDAEAIYSKTITENIDGETIEHTIDIAPGDLGNGNVFKYNQNYTIEVFVYQGDNPDDNTSIKGYSKMVHNIQAITKDDLLIQMSRYTTKDGLKGINVKFNLSEDFECFMREKVTEKLFDIEVKYGTDADNCNNTITLPETDDSGDVLGTNEKTSISFNIQDNRIYENNYFECIVKVKVDEDNDGVQDGGEKEFKTTLKPAQNSGFGNINADLKEDGKIEFVFNEGNPTQIMESTKIKYELYDENGKNILPNSIIEDNISFSTKNDNTLYYSTKTILLDNNGEKIDLSRVKIVVVTFLNEKEETLLNSYRIYK